MRLSEGEMTTSIRSMGANGDGGAVSVASAADILERELPTLVGEWFIRVEKEPELMRIPLNYEERTLKHHHTYFV